MTRKQLALHLLEEAGERGITTGELMKAGVGSRYGARLLELRAEGHIIESVRLRDGAWKYTLTSSPPGGVALGRAKGSAGGASPDLTPPAGTGQDQAGSPDVLFEAVDPPLNAAMADYDEEAAA